MPNPPGQKVQLRLPPNWKCTSKWQCLVPPKANSNHKQTTNFITARQNFVIRMKSVFDILFVKTLLFKNHFNSKDFVQYIHLKNIVQLYFSVRIFTLIFKPYKFVLYDLNSTHIYCSQLIMSKFMSFTHLLDPVCFRFIIGASTFFIVTSILDL